MRLDDINNAFIDYGNDNLRYAYFKYFRELERGLGRKLSKSEITRLIRDTPLDVDVTPQVISALVLADIQEVIQRRVNRNVDYVLAIALLTQFKKPETIAKKVYAYARGKISNPKFTEYMRSKQGVITRISSNLNKEMAKIIDTIKSDMSKNILSDFDKLQQQGLSELEIRAKLHERFEDNKGRVDRIVTTETHNINEKTKLFANTDKKYKIWNTQGDARVRDTAFHSHVAGKKILLSDVFQVGGLKASYPSDITLPVQERINCRCFLTFSDE